MSVPIITIPEIAYDQEAFLPGTRRRRSRLVRYLLTLTRSSALGLVLAYAIGLLVFRPLMETAVSQRLDFLECCRNKLRDLYLDLINRVSLVPIVGFDKKGSGKVYADALCQTDDLKKQNGAFDKDRGFEEDAILAKLAKLKEKLGRFEGLSSTSLQSFNVTNFSVKDLREKADLVYFDQSKLFNGSDPKPASRMAPNKAQEVKNNIRTLKGMYISGQI